MFSYALPDSLECLGPVAGPDACGSVIGKGQESLLAVIFRGLETVTLGNNGLMQCCPGLVLGISNGGVHIQAHFICYLWGDTWEITGT